MKQPVDSHQFDIKVYRHTDMAIKYHYLDPADFRDLDVNRLVESPEQKQNFWGNDLCSTSRDCSGYTECSPHFGCVRSIWKESMAITSVFVLLFVLLLCCRYARFLNAFIRRIGKREIVTHSIPSESSRERHIIDVNPQNTHSTPPPPYTICDTTKPLLQQVKAS